jgi:hypothetical protein
MDCHLALLFADATSAGANGMWSEVHSDDFLVLIIVVM